MTKKQKIWLAIFGAMFLVPEILWSPIGNFYYLIFFAKEWNEQTSQHFNLVPLPTSGIVRQMIGIMEIVGLLSVIGILSFYRTKYKFIKFIAIASILILFLLLFYIFIFSLNFNPQIG